MPQRSPLQFWNSSWQHLLPLPHQSRQCAFMNTAISPLLNTPIYTQQGFVICASVTPLQSVLLATVHAMLANPTIPRIHHTLETMVPMMTPPTAIQVTTGYIPWLLPGALLSTLSNSPKIECLFSLLPTSVQAFSTGLLADSPVFGPRLPGLISMLILLSPVGCYTLLAV